MKNKTQGISRRQFMYRTGALAGLAATSMAFGGKVFAGTSNNFPSQTMQVLIPTGEGGGVDRVVRAFNSVWGKHLGENFEYSYFPGAAGQVGYETFMGRRDANGYNLLFGNIGPEMIMYGTHDTGFSYPEDFTYFAGVDSDDSVIWVANDSPFKTIEDLVEAGQSQRINFSTSRIPHPSSLGVLALAEATGADFNLVPYGGGNAARSAAVTGEVDACTTFLGTSLSISDQVRFLTVFNDENRMPSLTNNAPAVNSVFDTSIPVLSGNRAWAIHNSVIEEYPERYEILKDTIKKVFEDSELENALDRSGVPPEFSQYLDEKECAALAKSFLDLTERYKDALTG